MSGRDEVDKSEILFGSISTSTNDASNSSRISTLSLHLRVNGYVFQILTFYLHSLDCVLVVLTHA